MPTTRARKKHESVHHALHQGQRHHVAVGDVGHLVAEHRFDFLLAHGLDQPARYRDQRGVAEGAGGERVRRSFVDRDLGLADAGLVGELVHRLHQPVLRRAFRAVDQLRAHRHLGDPFRHQERDESAAEAEDGGEQEQ